MKRRTPTPPSSRASRGLLASAMAGSALAIGAVHTLTMCIVCAVLGAAAVTAWWRSEPVKVRPAATVLLMTGVVLVAYTILQCVPMPIRWLAAVAPHNADVWSRALVPLHEAGPAWAPLTLDPPATHVEVLRGVAYLLAFVTALRIAHRREGVTFLSATIVATGILLALAALLHPAFGAKKVFGIYDPGPGVADVHIAPMMNPNNLAGYINLSFCLILASSLSREPRFPRAISIVLTVMLVAVQIWVASRGGVIAMAIGAATVTALALSERVLRKDPRTWLTVACGAATLVGAALIVVASSDKAKGELSITDMSKFALLLDVAKMVPAHGIFGVGRGAFESVFPRFRESIGYLTATNPENVVAQWVSEWGVPVGLAGLVSIALALRPTSALARSRSAAGAWAGLAALAAQNMADDSSEIPGVMVSAVVCAAIVVAGSAGLPPSWRAERWSRSPRGVALTGGLAAFVAILGAAGAVGHHVHEERRVLHAAAFSPTVSAPRMHELCRAAMLRHPSEPYLPFATALRAARVHDDNPIPWLGATFERAVVYGPAHLLLARVLGSRAPAQARLEYRLALEQAPETATFVIQEAPRLVRTYDDAMELVPPGAGGVDMLYWLVDALGERLPATAARLNEEFGARAPSNPGPPRRQARDAVADLEAGDAAPWCGGSARTHCVERSLTLARRVQALDPGSCDGYAFEARALAASGQVREGLSRLEGIADRVKDRVACLEQLAELARRAGDSARFEQALGSISRAGCASDKDCADHLVWVAQAEEEQGSPRSALETYKRAHDRLPDDDAIVESMARLAVKAGLNAEALQDYQELARRHPGDPRWAKGAEEQRENMMKGAIKF